MNGPQKKSECKFETNEPKDLSIIHHFIYIFAIHVAIAIEITVQVATWPRIYFSEILSNAKTF